MLLRSRDSSSFGSKPDPNSPMGFTLVHNQVPLYIRTLTATKAECPLCSPFTPYPTLSNAEFYFKACPSPCSQDSFYAFKAPMVQGKPRCCGSLPASTHHAADRFPCPYRGNIYPQRVTPYSPPSTPVPTLGFGKIFGIDRKSVV